MHTPIKTLVLGLGNLLHSDDGLGVHAIQALQRDSRLLHGDVVLMDGGTQGLALLPHISAFQRLIVIDAIDVGEAPGTLVRLEGEALKNLPGKASVHQLGFADVLVALELLGETPEEMVLLGIQPRSTEWSAELTPKIREALNRMPDLVLDQLEAWQRTLSASAAANARGNASG